MHWLEYTLLALTVAAGTGYYFWCLNWAFPLFLDKQIKRGKSWIYLPKYWNNQRRVQFRWTTRFFFLGLASLNAFLITRLLWSFFQWGFSWLIFGIAAIAFVFVLKILTSRWISTRYYQQEKYYFDKLNTYLTLYSEQGRDISEVEVRNRVRWEHQNALRHADQAGELLRVLKLNTKTRH